MFESNTNHVLDPYSCALFKCNIQDCQTPNGIMLYFQMYVWKERWKDGCKEEGKQKVREGTKTRPALIIAALPEEEDDGRRIRG